MKKQKRFYHEIAAILGFKLLGLFLLWWFCFSSPLARELTLSHHVEHLLGE